MPIAALSALAASFPTAEVEYEDLLGTQYLEHGRYGDRGINCLGVVLEIYRRAGLALPDHKDHPEQFIELLEEVTEANQLYDLVTTERLSMLHLRVVVRQGVTLSARARVGVYTETLNKLQNYAAGIKFYRVKASAIPSV